MLRMLSTINANMAMAAGRRTAGPAGHNSTIWMGAYGAEISSRRVAHRTYDDARRKDFYIASEAYRHRHRDRDRDRERMRHAGMLAWGTDRQHTLFEVATNARRRHGTYQ